ncbi:MAG: DUF4369 domain-containing protein [Bacteroidaceae bacterium]|nr:DUF4369 domain-containing protein [Bacteroidaceae bacterium]
MTNRISFFLLSFCVFFLTACKDRLEIQGSTTIAELEGKVLSLRVFHDGDLVSIDSTRIMHGKFHFNGAALDSVVMANLFLGDESIMPVVLDGHPLTILLNENERKVIGSELNDTLFAFIKRKTALDLQLAELPRKESRMILEGMDHDDIIRQLNQEAAVLGKQEDRLVVRFIKDNMDNVLGPGVFMIVTSGFPYPVLNPQIEELITLASPAFLEDAYVQEYIRMARDNMEKMNE